MQPYQEWNKVNNDELEGIQHKTVTGADTTYLRR